VTFYHPSNSVLCSSRFYGTGLFADFVFHPSAPNRKFCMPFCGRGG